MAMLTCILLDGPVKSFFILQVVDGTFLEEPGSGTVAVVDNRKVSVGTRDWVCRCCSHGFLLFS